MTWDHVFVGAGPATLAAASTLARAGVERILILEAGRPLARRGCPGRKRLTCTGCHGSSCHVDGGIGGASALFGNKMCYLPASAGVLDLVPSWSAGDVERSVSGLLDRTWTADEEGPASLPAPITRKFYDGSVLWRSSYGAFVGRLVEELRDRVEIRTGAAVGGVEAGGGVFELETSDGRPVRARRLTLACGRSGHRFLRRTFRSLGVSHVDQMPDVGLRLETSGAGFGERFLYQTDPKFKMDVSGLGSSRTFCTCAGGMIVPVRFGDAFFADGAFPSSPSGSTNVALMARTRDPLDADAIEDWCRDVNGASGGTLLLDEFDPTGRSGRDVAERIVSAVPSWPTTGHRELLRRFASDLFDRDKGVVDPDSVGDPIRVLGPSVDAYWPRPELREGFATTVPGVSVIGDAAGRSRGVYQALVSGEAFARARLLADDRPARSHGLGGRR